MKCYIRLCLADYASYIWNCLAQGHREQAEQVQFLLARIQMVERLYPTEVCKYILKKRGVISHTGSRTMGRPLFDQDNIREINDSFDALRAKASPAV